MADRWNLVLSDSAFYTWLIQKPGLSLVVVVLAWLSRWLLHRLIDRVTRRAEQGLTSVLGSGRAAEILSDLAPTRVNERRRQRAGAVASLGKSIVTSLILTIAVITIMAIFGIPIGPLLTSAGIAGVALGFGAQTLVKDYLAGVSMILEDQFGVGDSIDLGEASGMVEAVGLRVTRLRDVSGTVWYVRNGEVVRVGNRSQNWARAVLDITVSAGQDLDHIADIIRGEADALRDDPQFSDLILDDPEYWGVEQVDRSGVVLRLVVKTAPLHQADVARALRARIMSRFTAEGIRVPADTWPGSVGGSSNEQ